MKVTVVQQVALTFYVHLTQVLKYFLSLQKCRFCKKQHAWVLLNYEVFIYLPFDMRAVARHLTEERLLFNIVIQLTCLVISFLLGWGTNGWPDENPTSPLILMWANKVWWRKIGCVISWTFIVSIWWLLSTKLTHSGYLWSWRTLYLKSNKHGKNELDFICKWNGHVNAVGIMKKPQTHMAVVATILHYGAGSTSSHPYTVRSSQT